MFVILLRDFFMDILRDIVIDIKNDKTQVLPSGQCLYKYDIRAIYTRKNKTRLT